MLIRVALCLVAVVSAASANRTANAFVDDVLSEMTVKAYHRDLDPLRVEPFAIKVNSTGIGDRDLKANFTQGSLFGLSGVRRSSNCSYRRAGVHVTIGCYVSLATVRVEMNADVKGDTLRGRRHAISTSSIVHPNTYALIEIRARPRFPAELMHFEVNTINMKTSIVAGRLELSSLRYNNFISQVNGALGRLISLALRGQYSYDLHKLLLDRSMP